MNTKSIVVLCVLVAAVSGAITHKVTTKTFEGKPKMFLPATCEANELYCALCVDPNGPTWAPRRAKLPVEAAPTVPTEPNK